MHGVFVSCSLAICTVQSTKYAYTVRLSCIEHYMKELVDMSLRKCSLYAQGSSCGLISIERLLQQNLPLNSF